MYPMSGSAAALPTLIPGPFVLLLLLPAVPLLLFSFGARPPDTSVLPLSTADLWRTSVFVTVAGAVVLSIGVYPDVVREIGLWVIQGNLHATPQRPLSDGQPRYALGHSELSMSDSSLPRRGVRDTERLGGLVAYGYTHGPTPSYVLGARSPLNIGVHLYHLRNGIFKGWYEAAHMSPLTTILLSIGFALVLIVIVGQLIGRGYDRDIAIRVSSGSARHSSSGPSRPSSSGSARPSASAAGPSSTPLDISAIVSREIRKRRDEKPEETLERVTMEDRITKLDSSSKATLVAALKQAGRNIAGLEDMPAESTGATGEEKKQTGTWQRLQRKFLGKGLYEGLQKRKQESGSTAAESVSTTSLQTPGNVVEVTVQAQNTTNMANKLKADMSSTPQL